MFRSGGLASINFHYMQKEENIISHARETAEQTVMPVLLAISFCHLLNDTVQSLISAIYPIVKDIVSSKLHANRVHHVYVSMHRVAFAAVRWVIIRTGIRSRIRWLWG